MACHAKCTRFLLTGEPGSGKTTLVCKLVQTLGKKDFYPEGFYTEEKRINGKRVGFDAVTFNGTRETLATLCLDVNLQSPKNYHIVGKYKVDVQAFETFALPSLNASSIVNEESKRLIVIDEIGKMELFSKKFESRIKELFENDSEDYVILATIPIASNHPLVKNIREDKRVKIFQITKENRNVIFNEIFNILQISLKK